MHCGRSISSSPESRKVNAKLPFSHQFCATIIMEIELKSKLLTDKKASDLKRDENPLRRRPFVLKSILKLTAAMTSGAGHSL